MVRVVFSLSLLSGVGASFVHAQTSANKSTAALTTAQLRDRAIEQIVDSAKSDNASLRANAMEAAETLTQRLVPMLQLGAQDANPAVRFTALAMAGKLKIKALVPAAQRCLDDSNDSVRGAAMFALKSCGQQVDISPLSKMLTSQDPTTRGNAAMIVGQLGDKTAVPMLKELSRVPMPRVEPARAALVRLQFAEAMVKLGDDGSLGPIRAGAFSGFDEVCVMAVQITGRLNDRSMEKALADMLGTPRIEVQIAAAEAMARMGNEDGLERVLEWSKSENALIRMQCAMALGKFSDARAADARARLINDPQEPVRLAAAAAILTHRKPRETASKP